MHRDEFTRRMADQDRTRPRRSGPYDLSPPMRQFICWMRQTEQAQFWMICRMMERGHGEPLPIAKDRHADHALWLSRMLGESEVPPTAIVAADALPDTAEKRWARLGLHALMMEAVYARVHGLADFSSIAGELRWLTLEACFLRRMALARSGPDAIRAEAKRFRAPGELLSENYVADARKALHGLIDKRLLMDGLSRAYATPGLDRSLGELVDPHLERLGARAFTRQAVTAVLAVARLIAKRQHQDNLL